MTADPRKAAVTALSRVHRDGSYSNIVLDTLLQETAFEARDRALCSCLFYGVIERQITLDFVIEKLAARALGRIHPTVLEILRVALYQLLYMDKIPQSAAVNEAVRLTRKMGQPHAAGFVNALLRSASRQRETLFADLPTDAAGDGRAFRRAGTLDRLLAGDLRRRDGKRAFGSAHNARAAISAGEHAENRHGEPFDGVGRGRCCL